MSDVLDKLMAERRRVNEQARALDRRLHEIDAEIDEASGDALGAAWHRLAAADDPGEHMAWVRMMAARHIALGQPADSSRPEWQAQIAAEMERMQASPDPAVNGTTNPGQQ